MLDLVGDTGFSIFEGQQQRFRLAAFHFLDSALSDSSTLPSLRILLPFIQLCRHPEILRLAAYPFATLSDQMPNHGDTSDIALGADSSMGQPDHGSTSIRAVILKNS